MLENVRTTIRVIPGETKWVSSEREVIGTVSHGNLSAIRATDIKTKQALKSSSSVVLSFNDSKVPKPKKQAAIHFRSPEGILNYLGDVIAATQYQGTDHKIFYGAGYHETNLFNVVRGWTPNAPVKIADDEGEKFSIVRPHYGESDEDQSMSALTLVSQLISLQTQKDTLTSPQTITLQAN